MFRRRLFSLVASFTTLLLLYLVVWSDAAADSLTIPNRQPWSHVTGPCTSLDGAVFAIVGTGCGGTGTSFDTAEVFSPVVIKDVASADAPCDGIAAPVDSTCYRMWYVGTTSTWGTPRIGYAESADGLTWTRVPSTTTPLGETFSESGVIGRFDQYGVTYMSVIKDGSTFKMWYTGYDTNVTGSGVAVAGIGYAESTDGRNWIRIDGTLPGNAVLRAGPPGDFDEYEVYVPYVIKDVATADAPCNTLPVAVPLGGTCYRMWYEGTTLNGPGYRFRLGYAVSADGLEWTRIPGNGGNNANLGGGSGFDANSVAIAIVLKDGLLYRNWYEAKDYSSPDLYTIGHVVSISGTNWVRPLPNEEVYGGADDPFAPPAPEPDNVWSHWVIKDGARYKMWYTTSTRDDPAADRFAYASMVPGDPLAISRAIVSSTYTVTFTTTEIIPADGYVLVTLPPEIPFGDISAGNLINFQTGATLVEEASTLTDAAAAGVARGALLIRLAVDEPAGTKSFSFSLPAPVSGSTELLLQTFDSREVLEYGILELVSGTTAVQLNQINTRNYITLPALFLAGFSLLTLLYLQKERWRRGRES